MKKQVVIFSVIVWLFGFCSAASAQGLIINYLCTDIRQVPSAWIDSAKTLFKMTYGHTSHGSQVVTGMEILMNHDSLFDFFNDHYHYRFGGSNPLAPEGDLSLWDYIPGGDLGNPDRVTWAARTRTMLTNSDGAYAVYPHFRNLVMWSWCGQAGTATAADIDTYLTLMTDLETDFPDVTFVYMTGHLDGTGETGNLNQRNEQIRQHCITNNKVLFDFADIESYDPDGSYFLDRGANDNCAYVGGNWAQEWCAAHPGDPLCETCSCAHSQPLNCNLKARAFWWMLAKLAGWESNVPQEAVIRTDGTNLTLRWSPVVGATSYKVYSSSDPAGDFIEDLSGSYGDLEWTTSVSDSCKYYYVAAIIESYSP
ncbi:hypothetical protein KKH27_03670 [bacterium]|nr:hypothetical protein [bacterium]